MSLLDRYLAREILLPFLAGLVFLTQVLLASQLLAQADVLLGSGVSTWDLLMVVAGLTPHLLGYVLPVAFLLGAVLGVGRLAEAHEREAVDPLGIPVVQRAEGARIAGLGEGDQVTDVEVITHWERAGSSVVTRSRPARPEATREGPQILPYEPCRDHNDG